MVLLYCLITDDNSDNQSAFAAKNTGFFNKLRIVLMTLPLFEEHYQYILKNVVYF